MAVALVNVVWPVTSRVESSCVAPVTVRVLSTVEEAEEMKPVRLERPVTLKAPLAVTDSSVLMASVEVPITFVPFAL